MLISMVAAPAVPTSASIDTPAAIVVKIFLIFIVCFSFCLITKLSCLLSAERRQLNLVIKQKEKQTMNIRKIFTTIAAGVSMLALVGTAGAATIEINIHGASAQGDYWVALAPDFIKAQSGCSGATPVTKSYN